MVTKEKVGLREQLLEKLAELEHEQWAHWTIYFLENADALKIAYWKTLAQAQYSKLSESQKESDREWARKVLKIVDSFLEPSPQTKEIQKLFGACPLLTPSEYADKKSCLLFRERQVEWAINFDAKLEAFCADHVSRQEVKKLIESFPKPQLIPNQRYDCEVIKNPTAFANLCWRWKKDYLEKLI